ncbi:unnamed protein product [Linum trigynum]|uniref:Uncharacterized protein n=1 Tax=Linum trigynum TaxID=586398 RepID=A0AAV2C6D6_9ROSI
MPPRRIQQASLAAAQLRAQKIVSSDGGGSLLLLSKFCSNSFDFVQESDDFINVASNGHNLAATNDCSGDF